MKTNEICVIIAEDEPIILNNIAKKIDASADYIHVAGKATSGRETLALIAKKVPDILVTDIEMPGMNGLELIREVRRLYPQIHILILSGYSNFEYARTALQYGVDDYLLKPVSSDDLSAVLTKTADAILAERLQNSRNILSKTLQGDVLDCASPSFFTDGHFLLAFITLGNLISCRTEFSTIKNARLLWQDINFDSFLKEGSFDHFWVIDEKCPLQKFLILHTVSESIPIKAVISHMSTHIRTLRNRLPFCIMMQDSFIPYSEIGECSRKMRLSLPLYAKPFCQETIFYPGTEMCSDPDSQRKKEQYDFLYQFTNISSFLQYAAGIISEYIKCGYSEHTLDSFIDEVFHALPVLFALEETACIQAKAIILQKIYQTENWDDAFSIIKEELLLLSGSQDCSLVSDNICPKLKQFIIQNYNRHISMDDLSEAYGYTASYINRLFKKDYGLSPLQLQTELRMEKAKGLLRSQPDMDIKTIAAAIGYEDARYFSRVFKNETGITPSEFLSNVNNVPTL